MALPDPSLAERGNAYEYIRRIYGPFDYSPTDCSDSEHEK